MKKIFAFGLTLLAGSAFAQTYHGDTQYRQNMEAKGAPGIPGAAQGMQHMFEFNIDSIEAAALSFDKIKTQGQDADNGSNLNLSLNYAYGVHTFLQAAVRFDYFSGVNGTEDEENMNLAVGGILNFDENFEQALYTSLYVGAGWAQQFGDGASRDDLRFATLSVGKRMPLDAFGIKHVVYSPEVSIKLVNSTTDQSLDYSQSLQLKFLQFSVFF